MIQRTTDHYEKVVANFYKTHNLDDAVLLYITNDAVLAKIAEGHKRYMSVLTEAEKSAPEGVEELATQVAEKLSMEREAYDEKITEVFKGKFCEVFSSAIIYIDIRDQLVELLYNADSENLMALLESAMDDVLESMTNRFGNLVSLLLQGMPMEMAEEIADDAGDAIVCPIEVSIHMDDDDDECEDCDGCCCEGECDPDWEDCNGECGGKCPCKGKDTCEEDGCCHGEDPRD
ncbi:MAG: hypothetical protein IKJ36_04505 [Clostridia bacterium]|nr:hypothetical protein [Clostridia bacterium]